MKFTSLIGQRFGMLLVLEHTRQAEGKSRFRYLCSVLCDCGVQKTVFRSNLVSGATTSCGCIAPLIAAQRRNNKHPLWKGSGNLGARDFAQIRRGAVGRGIPFNIDIAYAWGLFAQQDGKCALSGVQLKMRERIGNNSKTTASLDRIDSTKGYEIGNVQWVSQQINRLKSNTPNDEFIALCKKVAQTCL